MVIIGLGLGVTMPVFTIAVQNAAPISRLGVVTSGIQFFRSIGGTVGTAIMGSFLNSRLTSGLSANVTPQLQQVLAQGPTHGKVSAQALTSPQAMQTMQVAFGKVPGGAQLFARFVSALRVSLAGAIEQAFTVGLIVVGLAALICFLLSELPLRKTNRPVVGPPALEQPEPAAVQGGATSRSRSPAAGRTKAWPEPASGGLAGIGRGE